MWFDKIRHLIMLKSSTSNVYSHEYTKIKIYSDDDLPSEKPLDTHNVVILNKSIFNKNHNHFYYQTFLKKCWYK